jgi:hypothetical protein
MFGRPRCSFSRNGSISSFAGSLRVMNRNRSDKGENQLIELLVDLDSKQVIKNEHLVGRHSYIRMTTWTREVRAGRVMFGRPRCSFSRNGSISSFAVLIG